ncbi:hypothetical protein E4T56_gene17915 [Termitomyces sp. T112]|nr:hypothetical protein E4T56_gene17915 [Termitomyces sp. T112]
MPFSVTALACWHRASSAYAIVYFQWMALTFECLFSAHSLLDFPTLLSSEDFASDKFIQMQCKLHGQLWIFDGLDFSKKETQMDILDNQFYCLLKNASSIYWTNLDSFSYNLDQLDDNFVAKYEKEVFDVYMTSLLDNLDGWIKSAHAKFANDPVAEKIINAISNKLNWLTIAQLGHQLFYPRYNTAHPVVTAEFIMSVCDAMTEHEESMIMIAGLYEPLVQAMLSQTTYNIGSAMVYSVLWSAYKKQNPTAEPRKVQIAINNWLGTLFQFCHSALEDIHCYNNANHPKEKNAPPYLFNKVIPLLTGPPNGDPHLEAMEEMIPILAAIIDGVDSDEL